MGVRGPEPVLRADLPGDLRPPQDQPVPHPAASCAGAGACARARAPAPAGAQRDE